MSTTFYLRKKASPEELNEVKRLVEEGDLWTLRDELNNTLKEYTIGTRSAGWQFGFEDHGNKFFQDNQGLIEWLKSGTIIDEYGGVIEFDEFWNEEIADFLWDGRSRFCDGDYHRDGLRFIKSDCDMF